MLDIPSKEELDSRLAKLVTEHRLRPDHVRYACIVFRSPEGKLLKKCRYEILQGGYWRDPETGAAVYVRDGDFEA